MIKKRRFPKIFFGWWSVLGGGILNLWGMGYYAYGFSALFKPISSELGWSRAVTSVPASIGRFEGGIEGPLSGWATDKFGPRWVVMLGVFIMSMGLIMMGFIKSLWAFYIAWGVLVGTGVNIASSVPLDTTITNWFVKKRGLALSIKWVFAGLSGVVTLPIIAWLISTQGWRMTCFIGGVVMLLIGLPIARFWFKPRPRPEYYGLLPDGATVEEEAEDTNRTIERGVEYAAVLGEVEFTLRQAMKTPTFWMMLLAYGVASGMASPALNVHAIPFLTDIGIDPVKAAGMMAIMVAASLPGRLMGGTIADHINKNHLRFLLAGAYFLMCLGFVVFLLDQTVTMVYVWFIIYGLGLGISFVMFPIIVGRYFGRKSFGSIQGTKVMIQTPFSMAAPIYFGWIYDAVGSYIISFITVAAFLAFAAVLMSFAQPPKPPAQVTDIRKFL
ncbi:MFS transporter [Chloroflexota bacterium]